MNRNDKAIEKFLASRNEKRERAAKARGVSPENSSIFRSVPAGKRIK